MPIVFPRALIVASFMAVAALALGAGTARADVAKRCDWNGCSYVHCNWTGDRCYRVDDHGRLHRHYPEHCGGHRHGEARNDDGDEYGDGDRNHECRHLRHHHDRDDDDKDY